MNPVSVSYDGEISIIKISNPPVNAISLEAVSYTHLRAHET